MKTFVMFVKGQEVARFEAEDWTDAKMQANRIMIKRGQLDGHYKLQYAK